MTPLRVCYELFLMCNRRQCLSTCIVYKTLPIPRVEAQNWIQNMTLICGSFQNLAVKERNEAVEAARLSTWWHFVCLLGSRVQELFDQVPFVIVHVKQLLVRQLLPPPSSYILSLWTTIIAIIMDVKNPIIIIVVVIIFITVVITIIIIWIALEKLTWR